MSAVRWSIPGAFLWFICLMPFMISVVVKGGSEGVLMGVVVRVLMEC